MADGSGSLILSIFIAFKAAELQDKVKAKHYLERLQELVFLERTNIGKIEVLHRLAISVGLDGDQFLDDMKGGGIGGFLKDLSLIRKHGISLLPTLLFKKNDAGWIRINGPQPLEALEKALQDLQRWPLNVKASGDSLNDFNMPTRIFPDSDQAYRAAG
jgi:predicted DsbA family dithiol-disulfide isomerase